MVFKFYLLSDLTQTNLAAKKSNNFFSFHQREKNNETFENTVEVSVVTVLGP